MRIMKKLVLVAVILVSLLGCATQNAAPSSGSIVVTGRITDEGVECLALRGDDGKLYTIGRPQNPPATGQRVRVTGTIAEMSICMQGTTISVEKLEVLE
jgi:hypothetical protein